MAWRRSAVEKLKGGPPNNNVGCINLCALCLVQGAITHKGNCFGIAEGRTERVVISVIWPKGLVHGGVEARHISLRVLRIQGKC